MLTALRIGSLAIIDSLEVRFEPGLNVLTGETGAGKSILVEAVGLLLGARADATAIRAGCEEAVVEGLFAGPGLKERARSLGLPDGDELVVRRTLSRAGRGRVHINGSLATVSMLSSLFRGLVDLATQHEHVDLFRKERHRALLDAFGNNQDRLALYEEAFRTLDAARREQEALRTSEAERIRRAEYLAFQLRELEELDPRPGEDEELAEERKVLVAADRLREAARTAEEALSSGEAPAALALAAACRKLQEASVIDERLGPILKALHQARIEVEEAAGGLSRYAASVATDGARLLEVDERLERLRRLARKHGGSLERALSERVELASELSGIEGSSSREGELSRVLPGLIEVAAERAKALSAARFEAAGRLSKHASRELSLLGMREAALSVRLSPHEGGPGPKGAEDAEFFLSANVGEEPGPLSRIASGGELSRVLLAVRRALAAADPVTTWVLDEVDAGISGTTALALGRMLREVARERQVLCITHLPQVAAFADVHLHVDKEVRGGRTYSRVNRLGSEKERARQLAALLSGDGTAAALAAAAELIGSARKGARRRRAA